MVSFVTLDETEFPLQSDWRLSTTEVEEGKLDE
jgi:hypothetical protein